ncbi:MAG TPA: hypothetical protein VEL47_01150 [Myxococcota bacterium]|nr:hypothetical protein [Myxococcota bacterium]
MGRLGFAYLAFLVVAGTLNFVAFAAGEADPTFGDNGKTITDFFGKTDVLRNMFIDGSGKILVGGSATGARTLDHIAIARYDRDGKPDFSFGDKGRVTANRIAGNKVIENGIEGFGLQSDGKIVACVTWYYGASTGIGLLRYKNNGSLDEAFGDDGSVLTPDESERNVPLALTIDSDDKIVVAAAALKKNSADSDFALFRYNADGSADPTFGIDGKISTKITDGTNVPRAVKIDKAGKIVVGGFSGKNKFIVVRYHADGVLDISFGEAGISTITFNKDGTDTLNALTIQSDGKIMVGGDVQVGSMGGLRMIDFGLARLTRHGRLDTSFNKTGKVITHFVQPAASSLWALTLDASEKIIAVGDASIVKGLAIARYNVDGSLDKSFGEQGKLVTPFAHTSHWEAVSLQEDGKIVAGGYAFNGKHYDIALARYLN